MGSPSLGSAPLQHVALESSSESSGLAVALRWRLGKVMLRACVLDACNLPPPVNYRVGAFVWVPECLEISRRLLTRFIASCQDRAVCALAAVSVNAELKHLRMNDLRFCTLFRNTGSRRTSLYVRMVSRAVNYRVGSKIVRGPDRKRPPCSLQKLIRQPQGME